MFLRHIFIAFFLLVCVPAWAQIDIQIQPNPVAYGEAVELIISSSQPFQSGPNLKELEKNFILGGQQQRQSSQWVNGVGKTHYELIYTLFPKKIGEIEIPSLQLGSQKTTPMKLTILDKSAQGGKTPPTQTGLELSVICDNTQIYPSQALVCTAQLIDPIGVIEGQIIPPNSSDYSWQPLNGASKSRITHNGKTANLWRQPFVFSTTTSGEIEIPAFMFQGQAFLDTTPPGAQTVTHWTDLMFMGMGTATRDVSALSKPFVLTVLNKPADWQGWWLPSTDVTLTETYQMPQKIHVGESIERTVVLSAKDIESTSLPVPAMASTDNIKVYPGLETRQETALGGQVTITFTIVPIHAGEITLPAVSVPWFDTKNKVQRNAVVPERIVFVEKGSEASASVVQPTPVAPTPTANTQTPESPVAPTKTDWRFWSILVAIIGASFVLGIIGTLLVMKHKLKSDTKQKQKKKKPLPDLYPF